LDNRRRLCSDHGVYIDDVSGMTPADKIYNSANSIGLACDLAHSLIHEHCKSIQEALNESDYVTNGSLSSMQLQKAAEDLNKFGGRLLWLARAVEKQRTDLLIASKHAIM
jgi:hypothetical protein